MTSLREQIINAVQARECAGMDTTETMLHMAPWREMSNDRLLAEYTNLFTDETAKVQKELDRERIGKWVLLTGVGILLISTVSLAYQGATVVFGG